MRQLIFILLAMIGVSQAQTIQYIGAPTTTVISRGNFRTDSIFYLPKRTKLPTDTAALRYQISDSSLYAWTGSQWRKVGADPDSLIFSTRAWRQKGDDSLAARINLKVNISDTASMLTPYLRKSDTTAMLSPYYRSATASAALALKLNISDTSSMLGNYVRHAGYGLTKSGQSFLVDTLNIATRAWRQKGLDSLAALEVSGSGTTNYVAKFTAGSTIGNSQIFDNGTNVGVGTASPLALLHINGSSATAVQSFIRNANGGTNSASELVFGTWSGAIPTGSGNPGPGAKISAINVNSANASTDLTFTTYNGGGTPGSAERLRITSGGDVGISQPSLLWTATNRRLLEINGTSQSLIGLNVNSLKAGYIWQNGNDMTIATENAGYIQFGTNGSSDRMRIFSNGRVGINTTTDAGYQLDINGTLRSVNGANFATTSGNVGVGTASPNVKLDIGTTADQTLGIKSSTSNYLFAGTYQNYAIFAVNRNPSNGVFTDVNKATADIAIGGLANEGLIIFNTTATNNSTATERMRLTALGELGIGTGATDAGDYKLQVSGNIYNTGSAVLAATSGEVLIGTTTDAGDYKLQVVGNARIGTGKLDIASNTTFGIGVARSGTSEVAGQIYNSNGILYLGAESSAGGQIFSGSSAYAAVIGSGANYPLQFAANNITRATLTTNGNFMIGFPTDTYFYRLQVNGSIFSNNQIIAQNAAAQLNIDSSTNISPLYISNQSLTGSSAQGLFYGSTTWNTTGNPSLIDLAITNTASGSDANYIKISDGSNIFRVTKAAEVVTAAPTGGSIRKWKLGEAATVSPTSPNRTIRVEIDGTVYYLHAKTTND